VRFKQLYPFSYIQLLKKGDVRFAMPAKVSEGVKFCVSLSMVSLMDTILGTQLRRAKMISERVFWRTAFNDPNFTNYILDLIRNDQLFSQGIDSDGDIIGYYSEWTEMMNPDKRAGTPYTLKDTGEFYESMIIYIYDNLIEIDADPIKKDDKGEETNLFNEYGENIIGLTDENLSKVALILANKYKTEIIRVLSVAT
jgi:hypothetical protein